MLGDALAVAVVSYTITISLAKTFALKHSYKVDSNQVRHGQFYDVIMHPAMTRVLTGERLMMIRLYTWSSSALLYLLP